MTNTLAAIITVVVTNWVTIGTFTPTSGGPKESVERGNLQTNTVAILEWKGAKHELILESVPGPVIGERKIPSTNVVFCATNWSIPGDNIILNGHRWRWTNTPPMLMP